MDGVLPLHFGERLDQAQIGGLFVGAALLTAVGAVLAARLRPRTALMVCLVLVVPALWVAGATDRPLLWVVALAAGSVGVGVGETGSTGELLEAVPTERIVTAMVVWSQLGLVGYLIGPVAGGLVVDAMGFAALGLVPLGGAVLVLVPLWRARHVPRGSR